MSKAEVAEADIFHRLLDGMRPKLHRYCARMTGSVIDGEDVVQEALIKAIEAYPGGDAIANIEGWMFRIAHNTALDFLRHRARQDAIRADAAPETIVDPTSPARDRQIAAASLRTFMRIPAAQRGSVILMDVLGYSLEEIAGVLDASVPAVKAALHRGRARLREIALEPDDRPAPILAEPERTLLAGYVDRFNARDFDAVRDMLAEDVRLDLVTRRRLNGRKEVGKYFENYQRMVDWRLAPGFVDSRPALLVFDPRMPSGEPGYFILIEWTAGGLTAIRDFYYARYAVEGAELVLAG